MNKNTNSSNKKNNHDTILRQKIGFDKIVENLKDYALSPLGKERIDKIKFYKNYDAIKKYMKQANEFVEILKNYDNFPTNYFYDARPFLNKIKVENTYLSPEELLKIKRSLDTVRKILFFFKKDENQEKFEELCKLLSQVTMYPYVNEQIGIIINDQGIIKDSASPELRNIRSELAQKQSSVSKVINSVLKSAKNEGIVDKDINLSVRNGKLLIPMSAYDKNKITGVVQDQSSSGKTVFIEPLKSIELNNEITELEFAEKREIIKILTTFADNIRPYIPDLINIYYFLAEIDFIRCRAKLAVELDASMPKISSKPLLDFRQAYHPLLFINFKAENKSVVPLDVEINDNQRIVLISGPNAGGKSVALKTVALVQYMAQSGLLVPVKPNSEVGIFSKILIDIGDQQSLENDLSTYSSHLQNMKNFMRIGNEKSLVLIDEFGTGTEPIVGAAIAEAILEEFVRKNVKGIITTHYSNLKHFAAATEGVENAAMLFDKENLRPLFMLETGKPGSSYAFEISQSIGLPKHVIRKAEQLTGKKRVQLEQHLNQIEEDKRLIEAEKNNLIKLRKDLQNREIVFRREQEKLLKERKQIIADSNLKAKQTLDEANKLIEKTIRDIKTKNAEKIATKNIRKNFEAGKDKILNISKRKAERLDDKLKKTQNKQPQKKREEKRDLGKILVGDNVKIKKSGTVAKVESLKDGVAMLVIGSMRTFVKIKDLEKISNNKLKKENKVRISLKNSDVQKNDFIADLDVRGQRAEEALHKVERYLDKAILANSREIRILHGKGNGILKQVIREYLNVHDLVKSCRDDKIEFGGAGITIVKLEQF